MALAFLAFAWLLGICAAALTGADAGALVAAASLLAAVTFYARPRASTLPLIAAGAAVIFAAGLRYETTTPAPGRVAALNETGEVHLRAVVVDEADERETGRLYTLSVRQAERDGEWVDADGRVLMRVASYPEYEYGDLLELRGELETPPVFPDFDYRDYLLRRGIASIAAYPEVERTGGGHGSAVRGGLIEVRGAIGEALARVLPEPQASLAGGILLGLRSDIPRDLRDDMNETGTSHLVAVSGQNVTIIAGLVIAALAWVIGRRWAAWVSLVTIIGYVALTGASPSVVRAGVMGVLYVVATVSGRQSTAPAGLAVAAAAMTVFDPQVVHDVSFQLSFAATLGLATLAPLLLERVNAARARHPGIGGAPFAGAVTEMLCVTTAAIVFTLPITAVNFHRVSLVAPFANLFAVPAFLTVAATSAVAGLAAAALPAAAPVLAWLAYPPAAYMTWAIGAFADLPAASVSVGGVNVWHATGYYGVLAALVWWLGRSPVEEVAEPAAVRFRWRTWAPALGLAAPVVAAAVIGWSAVTGSGGGDRLIVTFLDVGQGDAILIESPAGHRVLVDGGPSGRAITTALGRNLPFDSRRIDLVVATHAQADHIGGLPDVLDAYDVRAVLMGPVPADGALPEAFAAAVAREGVSPAVADSGQAVDLGGGARLEVIAPDADDPLLAMADANEASVVLRLTLGEASFLLTGDIEADSEARLLAAGAEVSATVLKVAHHGSRTSSTPAFLARVNPAVDVISAGDGNRFGHPNPEVVSRLGGQVFRTDLHGDIEVTTDGVTLAVRTQR